MGGEGVVSRVLEVRVCEKVSRGQGKKRMCKERERGEWFIKSC